MIKHYARWVVADTRITNDFKIIDCTINDSIRETTYSYATIDFSGHISEELPLQFSQIQIISKDELDNETLEFVGHLDSIKYPDFTTIDKPLKLELSILNLRGFLTKLAITKKIDNQSLNDALVSVLSNIPLMGYSGFFSDSADVKSYRVSDIFINQPLEKVMNYMANKFNFLWLTNYYISAGFLVQEIKVYDIDKYISTDNYKVIDETNCFISSAIPSYTTVDYANVLNIRNIIWVTYNRPLPAGTELISGETYTFEYPLSISENTCFRLNKQDPESEINQTYAFYMNTDAAYYSITIDLDSETIIYSDEIGFDGIDNNNSSKRILLITDANDTTKVLGFKWKGDYEVITDDGGLYSESYSSLIPYQVQYIEPNEILKIAPWLNTSGRVEKIVDANGKYFTTEEMNDYATSLFGQNNLQTNEIEINFKGTIDETIDYELSDVVYINLPSIQTTGTFLITDISKELGTEIKSITIKARSKNVNENAMDIYRNELEQETEDKLTRKLVAFYNQDEKTLTNKEIYVNGVRVDVES